MTQMRGFILAASPTMMVPFVFCRFLVRPQLLTRV
jgi:hypothetical protein